MEVKTYRAGSLQQALQLVRSELGPDAAVLHTRQVAGGLFGLLGTRQVEVMAALGVDIPSRFVQRERLASPAPVARKTPDPRGIVSIEEDSDYRSKFRQDLAARGDEPPSVVEALCERTEVADGRCFPGAFARLFDDLVAAEVDRGTAHELLDRLRRRTPEDDWDDRALLQARLARVIEEEIPCSGGIQLLAGTRRLVALVGPTGVGKTTTVAKLAAHFHLREKRRVGLITVDTYRIAAVDQLRTYADIIDLPMEVVATPREMRTALARLSDMELVLMDTAGRSPSDELRIQELRALLAEARADEVHLVLSSVSSPSSIRLAAEQFATVGVHSWILTKLDEAAGTGSLLVLQRHGGLPLSYITMGQNVPDDIAPANARRLARSILKMDIAS
jgi:flagellar biosynthesis protein FlhF